MIWEQGAIDVIPSKSNRKLPKDFDRVIYKERNKIERFFGRLKASFRRIATRYEKTSQNFLAMIKLASVRLWIEFYESAALFHFRTEGPLENGSDGDQFGTMRGPWVLVRNHGRG